MQIRLPSKQQESDDATAYLVQQLELLPVTALSLKAGTLKDPELTRVMSFAQSGWPHSISEDLKPFFVRRDELTIEQGSMSDVGGTSSCSTEVQEQGA